MVIRGRQPAVGLDATAVAAAIHAEERRSNGGDDSSGDAAPELRIEHRDGRIQITLAVSQDKHADATVWLVRCETRRDVPIKRGENARNQLSYYNVARDMRALGQWHGQAMLLNLSRAQLADSGQDGCAIIVQEGPVSPILAAARTNFLNPGN